MSGSPSFLRPIAILAGSLGIVQSLVWIGLTITSIVAFYCHFDFTDISVTMGSITGLTIFQVYFRGACTPNNFPEFDTTTLTNLNLMRPVDLHAWTWVYLMISVFWFISSITLITHVKSKYIRWVNVFLYFWVGITLAVAAIDLVLGILFGIDYDTVMNNANNTPFLVTGVDGIPSSSHIVIAAQDAIRILISVVLRGYIIWVINVVLAIYLFTETFSVSAFNHLAPKTPARGVSNNGFIEETRQNHPIDAFGSKDVPNLWYGRPTTASQPQPELNPSRSVFEERKQFYNSLQSIRTPHSFENNTQPQQPQPQTQQQPQQPQNLVQSHRSVDHDFELRQSKVVRELNQRQSQQFAPSVAKPSVPDPDYSPPMPRVNPFDSRVPKSALRSSRF